ncbi:BBE domain-containing protein [Limobrevibacterium gyesilva]|uniref:BBE domain-containing protein n=1 Tax=Limobrevibacterium gyesilva TaxID=2991712 RepID=A0AA42CK51_9PROT|nr:BBE domain-containing protein [Limobrevibacterium gyesilva]MCW3477485.1 BBE domain-containing protein [Limobrevibacterium gyesilva]
MDADAPEITAFKVALRGPLLQPADETYEAARVVWSGMIDRCPRLIVRCHGVADVVASVDFARTHGVVVAVRGGGGNFGIVTLFEFRLHPIEPELMACLAVYPESRAREAIASWRDFMATAPDQLLGSLVEFSTLPNDASLPQEARGARAITVAAAYDGPAREGETLVQPLRELGPMLVDFSWRMPYCALQSMLDDSFPKGHDRSYYKSLFLRQLDGPVIEDLVTRVAARPSDMTYTSIWDFGGAVARVAADATAFGDRNRPYVLSIDTTWSKPEGDGPNIAWSRNFWSHMQPHSDGRIYVNFPGHGEDDGLVRTAVGAENYARLVAIKRKYDPTNFFRINQNIAPDSLPRRQRSEH